ncbi:MAG TPA: glycosyltransferase N-terminal domain-containing protein, partial [Saprospiraceae bacterium]|nr:glycosyltransferase N-terminal domain-containing protein [Saprospiraceae bacterium]
MLRHLYTLAIWLYTAGIHVAAPFHKKAAQWVAGRRPGQPSPALPPGALRPVCTLWLHAASLGEFEQGRPLLEAVRQRHPDWRILLSFFSPSGYEMRKHYPHADWVGYLPPDLPASVEAFLEEAKPNVAVFVKYEFWANYLFALRERSIPTLLVSALFRPDQPFFRWYGSLWRQMLRAYTHLFVQDRASADLLLSVGVSSVTVAGDTRVDRVLQIAQQAAPDALVADFVGQDSPFVLVAGSTWEADEDLIAEALKQWAGRQQVRLIIAPHDPAEAHVSRIEGLFAGSLRYSRAKAAAAAASATCLIIDNVGLLNTLYRYGSAAYIGGGHGKGIHNTLEP